jgi:hypothetical protein
VARGQLDLTTAGDGWIDRKERARSNVAATLLRHDGSSEPVMVTNLSDEGCRIETDRALAIGERLRIAIPRVGELTAQIRWTVNGSAGARFDRHRK